MAPIAFDNSYARLPDRFFARLDPTPVAAPRLIRVNLALAEELGIDPALLTAGVLAGNAVPEGAAPLAQAYAGHQFGHFSPRLGDGRAILLGEVVGRDGLRRDIQLKGSGPTPFSRSGDGRAALGPVLREYIVSEAMAALGVPTTRSLGAALTGEHVMREVPLPGAVLARVAASHLRVGTFQYFAARGDLESVRLLVDHAVARHQPDAIDDPVPALALFRGVVARQAALVARWLGLGFIHGVMNTDNMTISGETIDYGPCAFMEAYDPAMVFSSIDHAGRYAYANQPRIAQWNLARLAEALLPLLAPQEQAAMDAAQEALAGFVPTFQREWLAVMRAKAGLAGAEEGDAALLQDLLGRMAENAADFTLTFRALATDPAAARPLFRDPTAFDAWAEAWGQRRARGALDPAAMRQANPAFIPRNHRVEEAIAAAVERDDFAPFETLLAVLARPQEDQPEHAAHALPAAPDQQVTQTFCGT
ncbi:protein adenylyltransferase SelO [Falsiroseomonas selenitidurans]|uniref:Protein nucleotidyltransferase YdiU n=1 Tax=Falsiroseomonas selenitidurans TaxID=2716335 RepID=A0ABX1E9C1_9PROT|nr:YdiU family protein [Falsiroseomonas selenitidurans]NKC33418.1 YdiU family protein [Falsiroseomonas selenitidurans]